MSGYAPPVSVEVPKGPWGLSIDVSTLQTDRRDMRDPEQLGERLMALRAREKTGWAKPLSQVYDENAAELSHPGMPRSA
jgi:hypothetical protein